MELEGKINDVDEQSEFVKDVLEKQPSWVLRFGLLLFSGIVILIFVFLYLIRYPDVLTADITLTTLNPPVTIVAKSPGKLTTLFVGDKALVKKDQPIAVIENTADYADVLYLSAQTSSLISMLARFDSVSALTFGDSLKVGEITPYYFQVLKASKDVALYKYTNAYQRRISLLQIDVNNYKSLLAKYGSQARINGEQLALGLRDFERDSLLYAQKSISARELENKKRQYLDALAASEQIKINVSNCMIQLNASEKEMLQLQIQDYQDHQKLRQTLMENLNLLAAQIETWKRNYLLQSPIEGRVSFFNVWAINQNIQAGEELFAVVPAQKEAFIGKCQLPLLNSGKLEMGQDVNIRVNNYPFEENGMLHGVVSTISEMPNEDHYAVDITLPEGLLTSYKKMLPYQQQMKGRAEIITRNMSMLDRIFFSLRKTAGSRGI